MVTAHALLAERSAELERGVLASMPPQVLAKVLANAAASGDADVVAFRAMVEDVLAETSPSGEAAPAFAPAGASLNPYLKYCNKSGSTAGCDKNFQSLQIHLSEYILKMPCIT